MKYGARLGQFSCRSAGRMLMPFSSIKHAKLKTRLINILQFLPQMLILLIFAITTLLFHNSLHLFVLTAVDKENPSIVLSNLRSSCSYKK